MSVFPVGLVLKYGVSSPILRDGKVTGFYDAFQAGRKVCFIGHMTGQQTAIHTQFMILQIQSSRTLAILVCNQYLIFSIKSKFAMDNYTAVLYSTLYSILNSSLQWTWLASLSPSNFWGLDLKRPFLLRCHFVSFSNMCFTNQLKKSRILLPRFPTWRRVLWEVLVSPGKSSSPGLITAPGVSTSF